MLTGVITVDEFFGPLGDTTTWLLIGAFIISTGVATSGLAMRGAVIVTAGTKNPRMLVHAVTLATVCTVLQCPQRLGERRCWCRCSSPWAGSLKPNIRGWWSR